MELYSLIELIVWRAYQHSFLPSTLQHLGHPTLLITIYCNASLITLKWNWSVFSSTLRRVFLNLVWLGFF